MTTPWASIAKIEANGLHSGTGFLVTKNYVLTALHVVADSTGRPFPQIVLRFDTNSEYSDGSTVFETKAQFVEGCWSLEHDFVLLECQKAPPSKPLILGDRCQQRDDCSSSGFAIQDPSGFTVIGNISSLNDPIEGGGTAIGIQFQFGSGVLMKGHSGAPVFVNDRVVGLLRKAFLDDDEKTMGGMLYATSIARVVEFCNQVTPGLLGYRRPVAWPSLPTRPDRILADRKGEFEIFERMITGQSKERILLLRGESGSGKTVLAAELIKYATDVGIKVAQADCKGCPSMDSVFSTLLLDFGPEFLRQAETAAGGSRFFAMIEDLIMIERPLLIAVDTWQESSDEVRKWMEKRFLSSLLRMPAVLVMIGGQEVPNQKGQTWEELAVLRELELIRSTDDWFEYSRRKWPSSNLVKEHIEAVTLMPGVDGRPNVIALNLEVVHRGLGARGASQQNK